MKSFSHTKTSTMTNVFILPGLGNSGEQHWQTLWEQLHPSWIRIMQDDWDTPHCTDWVRRIDETLSTNVINLRYIANKTMILERFMVQKKHQLSCLKY
jgi:Serine hydrolase